MIRTLAAAALTLFIAATPLSAAEQPKTVDLTPQFRAAGVTVDDLKAIEIGGIVVLRGRAATRVAAEEAGRVARSLGHARVANLIQLIEAPDDAAIERRVERELSLHRSLDGCAFSVQSTQGVVHVAGSVRHELQKDMTLELLRNVDGVRAVTAKLEIHR